MDELTLLRNARTDVPKMSSKALAEGREALLATVEADGRPRATYKPRRTRLRWYGTGVGVLGATAVASALIITNALGIGGWRGGADSAAATVLHEAALTILENSDPALTEGQYLQVTTETRYGVENPGAIPPAGTVEIDHLYIPADRSAEWVWVIGDDEIVRAPKGAFYSYEQGHSPERVAALPRDPEEMLEHIYTVTEGSGSSPDGAALTWIADTLRSGAMPADLRATLYNTAAMIPGVEVTDRQANLNGAVGIAIGRLETVKGIRDDLVIDPVTGRLIGERSVQVEGGEEAAGTVLSWTAVTTTIVDSAPDGGSLNGAWDDLGCVSVGGGDFQCPRRGGQ